MSSAAGSPGDGGGQSAEWSTYSDGEIHGPFTLARLVDSAKRVDSLAGWMVRHPKHTKNEWIAASRIKPIVTAFADSPMREIRQVQAASQAAKSPRISPGSAAILSFLLPGLGQMCLGRTVQGILILIGAFIGYFTCIVPGLIVHLAAVVDAATNSDSF